MERHLQLNGTDGGAPTSEEGPAGIVASSSKSVVSCDSCPERKVRDGQLKLEG